MDEKRQFDREPMVGVTTLVHCRDGTVLEGVVRDVSDGGVQVFGDAAGLVTGDPIDLVLVVDGQSIRYDCEVRRVDHAERLYGIRFLSGPKLLQPAHKVKRCMRCNRDFPTDCNYCSHCGQRLVALTA